MSTDPLLGIVIPTLNESRELPFLLDDLSELSIPHRVMIVDGGSVDGTPELARSRRSVVRSAPRGRSSQLNAGAGRLDTPWLLFLHADVRLTADARAALEEWLPTADPDDVAFFSLRLAGDHWFYRFAEAVQRLRERISGLAYGDQGLLIHRRLFDAVGGYPPLPVMEDVEIIRRIRKRARPVRLPADLVSSPRRYEREGRWFGWLRNGLLLSLYLVGVPPRVLARWYRPEPYLRGSSEGVSSSDSSTPRRGPEAGGDSEDGSDRRILLVFAKAPMEGRVKTRLAREIGPERATRLYREVGRRIVDQLRDGPYRTVVCYAPPDAGREVRSWLGAEGLDFRPQEGAGLGERMAESFRWAFGRAREVCIVGTDAPGVGRHVVTEAFAALADGDLVLGPASDGGYYLMALSEPRPDLFRDIVWSTSGVLEATLERADHLGLRVHLLGERTDLDTSEDLERLGLGES